MDLADLAHLESEIWLQSALHAVRERRARSSASHCRNCGNPIPAARRHSLPQVSLCIGCAEVAERHRALHGESHSLVGPGVRGGLR